MFPLYGQSLLTGRPKTACAALRGSQLAYLPLDRLVSHRLPLDEVERGFELMRSGEALRVVLDLSGGAAG